MKEWAIKLSDYIEFKQPKYLYLKLVPSNSIRNYNSDKIISLVAGLYRAIDKQIRNINKKLFFECSAKVSYYIYMEKSNVQFYFIVPEAHYNAFRDKIIDVWSNKITISEVDKIPIFDKECTKYYMDYRKEDAMSLSCDKRNNLLLNSLLTTLHVMEDGDKVGVLYNFMPTNQRGWRVKYDRTITKLKHDEPINKNKLDLMYIFRKFTLLIAACLDTALDTINLGRPKKEKPLQDLYLTKETINKRDATIVKAQILCFSESPDKSREYSNAISVCQSFQCLDSDNGNSITYRKYSNKNYNILDTTAKGVSVMMMQTGEAQSCLSLPGKEILDEYKIIEHTSVLETEVPLKLQRGYISLGVSTYHGNPTEAFHRDTYDQGNFPFVLIGEQGSGKTTAMSNYVNCILTRDEGCMVIDFIKNCELSESIKKVVPKDRLIELDLSDTRNAQGIGYNELKPSSNKPFDLLDIANRKAIYIQMLIDALNDTGKPDDQLSTSMDRYLSGATNIVFLNNNASLKDVVRCLNDHAFRRHCIEAIPNVLSDDLSDEISALNELDELNKDGEPIGTRMSKIDGINHRINLLRKDLRLKMMFNRDCSGNINLVDAMNDGKIILVKMPQEYFATSYSKNVIVTYLFTKIWAAQLVRGSRELQPKRFHVLVDEIFQAKTAMKMLKTQETLPQTRKFGCKFVLSCQYLGQIELINQTLKSAGASYMLLKGSGRANFNELKDELAPYTLEDLEALPQYSSLNIINYEDGRAKFVTKLPKPL
jgi:GTPase SAR1 family protein